MEFTVEFYETSSGRCPVRRFLDKLKGSDPDDFAAVLAGLAKLRNSKYHRPALSKSIGDDLFELRHVGKLNTRVLYFFMKGRRIILVHGLRKKTRANPVRDRHLARQRKEDWLKRNST
jgi:phage-related protein